jgi:chromosome segregation ATPase
MSLSNPLPGQGFHRPTSPRLSAEQARVGAEDRVQAARDAVDSLQWRHERAVARLEALNRRRAALELELADAERERDQTATRLESTTQALEAAEHRLSALSDHPSPRS